MQDPGMRETSGRALNIFGQKNHLLACIRARKLITRGGEGIFVQGLVPTEHSIPGTLYRNRNASYLNKIPGRSRDMRKTARKVAGRARYSTTRHATSYKRQLLMHPNSEHLPSQISTT